MANPHPVSRLNKPNKYSSARVQRALAEGKRLPPEDLLTLAGNCMAMAARFAPVRVNDKTKKPERNRDYNYDRYLECMRDARECLKAAATRSSAPSCGAAFDRQRRHPYRGADASGGAAQMHNAALAAVPFSNQSKRIFQTGRDLCAAAAGLGLSYFIRGALKFAGLKFHRPAALRHLCCTRWGEVQPRRDLFRSVLRRVLIRAPRHV
jgi:hypothetical protein